MGQPQDEPPIAWNEVTQQPLDSDACAINLAERTT